MDIPTVPGTWYTVASTTTCEITDTATGTPLGTADAGSYTFQAQGNLTTLSDDSALYSKSNFKSAPAAMKALGLLGGGASTPSLPGGYLAAEFLTAENTLIALPLEVSTKTQTLRIETMSTALLPTTILHQEGNFNGGNSIGMGQWNTGAYMVNCGYGGAAVSPVLTPGASYTCWLNITPQIYSFGSSAGGEREEVNSSRPAISSYFLFSRGDEYLGTGWYTRKKWWRAWVNGEMLFDLIPCITPEGVPVMYNKVDGAVYGKSLQSGALIVGFTLTQARKLGKLPATGGTLTISLPSNWQEDEGVVNALATAEANGWVFTYQTYEADASTASTFALRRIFVRKTQNENGQYVAADGSRWYVEWCAGMIGAEPTDHGYELFRSQEAAVAYWELSPYVDPESENLLTEQ